jgi:hypothetical protein
MMVCGREKSERIFESAVAKNFARFSLAVGLAVGLWLVVCSAPATA